MLNIIVKSLTKRNFDRLEKMIDREKVIFGGELNRGNSLHLSLLFFRQCKLGRYSDARRNFQGLILPI